MRMLIIKLIKLIIIRYTSFTFNKKSNKTALLSFIVHPLIKKTHNHPNSIELDVILNSLINLGYRVKVVDYRRKKIHGNYDLILGFGHCYEYALKKKLSKKFILYSTGSPFPEQNANSLKSYARYIANGGVEQNHPDKYLRITEGFWNNQLVNSDFIITIGNKYIVDLFNKYNKKAQISSVPCLSYVNDIECNYLTRLHKRKVLWFGGKGCLHKGLDLCIAAINLFEDITLVVAGPIEKEFYDLFRKDDLLNVEFIGHVDVFSESFIKLMKSCSFVILPSCSEGIATSIVTVCSSAGVIPIVSEQCGFDFDSNIIPINTLTIDSVVNSISFAFSLSEDEVIKRSKTLKSKMLNEYNKLEFSKAVNEALKINLNLHEVNKVKV